MWDWSDTQRPDRRKQFSVLTKMSLSVALVTWMFHCTKSSLPVYPDLAIKSFGEEWELFSRSPTSQSVSSTECRASTCVCVCVWHQLVIVLSKALASAAVDLQERHNGEEEWYSAVASWPKVSRCIQLHSNMFVYYWSCCLHFWHLNGEQISRVLHTN